MTDFDTKNDLWITRENEDWKEDGFDDLDPVQKWEKITGETYTSKNFIAWVNDNKVIDKDDIASTCLVFLNKEKTKDFINWVIKNLKDEKEERELADTLWEELNIEDYLNSYND